MNDVKIKSESGKTEVFVNDRKIPRITGLRFEQNAGEIPMFEIELPALPDFEVDDADIRFSITQHSVVSALNVIRTAFSAGNALSEEILDAICCLLAEITEKDPSCCAIVKKGGILTGRIIQEEADVENNHLRKFVINTSD